MIARLIPHPVLSLLLVLMWMVLTGFSLGHFLLGGALALFAGWTMHALQPKTGRPRRPRVIARLAVTLFFDIIRSNIAVTRLILTEGRAPRRQSCFLIIPLGLRSPSGLAILAVILTATPGTAWVEYVSDSGTLILHVFDGAERDHYLHVINQIYAPMLQEIFE